jgi:hypothetical protein
MIAEAAYLRASGRNFTDNDPLGDWLAAESDIEQSLQMFCASITGRKPLEQYHRVGLVPLAERWWQHLKNWIEAIA